MNSRSLHSKDAGREAMNTPTTTEIEEKLKECEKELNKALLTIQKQQQYIADLTTSPFKLFDVNKQSKQYKSHLTRQQSLKKNLVKQKSSYSVLMAKRDKDLQTFTNLRAQIFHDTQKLAAMNLVITNKTKAEEEVQKQEDKRDELLDKQLETKQQLKEVNAKIAATKKRRHIEIENDGEPDPEQKEARAGAAVRLVSQPALVDAPPQSLYRVNDPYASVPDETLIQLANNAYPTVRPVATRAAALLRLQPSSQSHSSSSPALRLPPLPAFTQDPHREPPPLERFIETQLPPSPASGSDNEAMSDNETNVLDVGQLNVEPTGNENDDTSSVTSSVASSASSNTRAMENYI